MATKFTVEDNPNQLFSDEEVKVSVNKDRLTQVIKMSYKDLVELQTTISTYIAGERADG